MTEKSVRSSRSGDPQREHALERSLTTAGWGAFLVWTAIVLFVGMSSGAILLGAGAVILLHQGVRRITSLPADRTWLFLGLFLAASGLWRIAGAEFRLLPAVIFAAGVLLLVSSWRTYARGR